VEAVKRVIGIGMLMRVRRNQAVSIRMPIGKAFRMREQHLNAVFGSLTIQGLHCNAACHCPESALLHCNVVSELATNGAWLLN
jgi:hypothetical protein